LNSDTNRICGTAAQPTTAVMPDTATMPRILCVTANAQRERHCLAAV
jgi:hypothetical protein